MLLTFPFSLRQPQFIEARKQWTPGLQCSPVEDRFSATISDTPQGRQLWDGFLNLSLCSDFLAATKRLSQCKCCASCWMDSCCWSSLPVLQQLSLCYAILQKSIDLLKITSIFAFYLTNPPPTFSLDNYSLFPMGGGRKGFPLETQLAGATQRNKKASATESKSLKGSIHFYWEKQKLAHYHFQKICGLGKVTPCHH